MPGKKARTVPGGWPPRPEDGLWTGPNMLCNNMMNRLERMIRAFAGGLGAAWRERDMKSDWEPILAGVGARLAAAFVASALPWLGFVLITGWPWIR